MISTCSHSGRLLCRDRFSFLACGLLLAMTINATGQCTTHEPSLVSRSNRVLMLPGDGTVYEFSAAQSPTPPPPVQVPGLPEIRQVAIGASHQVALDTNGGVWAWGDNSFGQLGIAGISSSSVPLQIPGLAGVTRIAAGWRHNLALTSAGLVIAWGDNLDGQLGVGSVSPTPGLQVVPVVGTIVDVQAGSVFSLYLRADGVVLEAGSYVCTIFCTTSLLGPVTLPSEVAGVVEVLEIFAGEGHALALHVDGTLSMWGDNSSCQSLINSIFMDGHCAPGVFVPTTLPIGGVIKAAAGGNFSIAMTHDKVLRTWGHGFLSLPAELPVNVEVHSLAASLSNVIALTDTGAVYEWNQTDTVIPTVIPDISSATVVTADSPYVAVISDGGDVSAWGWHFGAYPQGQNLPPGALEVRIVSPREPNGGPLPWGAARYPNGDVWQFGILDPFSLGSQGSPIRMPFISSASAVSVAREMIAWITSNGTAHIHMPWLINPMEIPNASPAARIVATQSQTYVVRQDGVVVSFNNFNTSTPVPGLSGITDFWAGRFVDFLALRSDGTVMYLQSQNGGPPVPVTGLSGVVRLGTGDTPLAVKGDGTVWRVVADSMGVSAVPITNLSQVEQVAGASDVLLALHSNGTITSQGPSVLGLGGRGIYTAPPILRYSGAAPFRTNCEVQPNGDALLQVTGLPCSSLFGVTAVSATTPTAPGLGPVAGITPDALTATLLASAPIASPGHPIHWTVGTPTVFPHVPFLIPNAVTQPFIGLSWDITAVAVVPGRPLRFSSVVRVDW